MVANVVTYIFPYRGPGYCLANFTLVRFSVKGSFRLQDTVHGGFVLLFVADFVMVMWLDA